MTAYPVLVLHRGISWLCELNDRLRSMAFYPRNPTNVAAWRQQTGTSPLR